MNLEDILDRLVQLESRLQKVEAELDLSGEQELSSHDVDPGITTTTDLVNRINANDLTFGTDRRCSISAMRIRVPSQGVFAVGGEQSENDQITGFLDALHWHRCANLGAKKLSFVLGSGERLSAVSQAIALLMSVLNNRVELSFQVDFDPSVPRLPNLDLGSSVRLEQLRRRATAELPPLAEKIREAVNDPCFRWLRPLTSNQWSGRVDGLEICCLDDAGQGELRIGKTGKKGGESTPRNQFRALVGADELRFDEKNVNKAVEVISKLVSDRRCGTLSQFQQEHMLEARVLRGVIPLAVGGVSLQMVESQFPALWSEESNAKFIDVIGRIGDVPVVVELKVPEGGGQGQYFRNAVGQVALYREFIRRATGLHPWFAERNLDVSKCKAVVAFPMRGTEQQRKAAREPVQYLASLFDVEVVELPDNWNAPDL